MSAETQIDARPFDEMPVITRPDNYPYVMPTFLAQQAQRLGPIFRISVAEEMHNTFGQWIVFMVGPEANRFVMHSHRDHFSHDLGWSPTLGGIFEKGLLNTDDPEHARHRKLMNPAFVISYMSRYLPVMNRVVADRSRDWAERGEIDIYAEARKITFDVAAECLTGLRTGDEVDHLRELFYLLVRPDFEEYESFETYIARMMEVRAELDAMLLAKIAERRRAPTDDILGMLVKAGDEQGLALTDRELLGQLHILLVAGHETTTTLSAWLLYLLAAHPDILARIHTEMDEALAATEGEVTLDAIKAMRLLGNAVEEAGRLHSPVGNVPRGVVKDFTFGGYYVPAETRVLLSLAACHRLPNVFANPDTFDPDRFAPPREEDKRTPYSLVTFGGGPRICIGINFAQVEVKAIAAHILRHYMLTPTADQIEHAYYSPVASLNNGIRLRVARRAVNG
ncbi:MAG TPA: cytochrome P450 [Ktedonobacterales bacterium]|nr:cytochrome P450 [Ktedonobacterales bacterium]